MDKNDFYEKVYALVRQIPPGKVSTYGTIAKHLGMPRSSRMVGYALNASHGSPLAIPAHRVVNRMGMLSGKMHFESPTAMQEKLEAEGIAVKDDCILNFEQHLWLPKA